MDTHVIYLPVIIDKVTELVTVYHLLALHACRYAPFWRKSGLASAAKHLEQDVELSEMQKQLLALEQRGAGNIFDPEWLHAHPRPDIR